MGADANLVQGAYRAAMANVPVNYTQFYQQQQKMQREAISGTFQALSGAFSSIMSAKKEKKRKLDKQAEKFNETADALITKLAVYEKNESLNEKMYNQYFEKIQFILRNM